MQHYTYIHRRSDTGEIFYVGKGQGARAKSKCGRNIHWRRIVAKSGFTHEILAHWETELECFAHEEFLITLFREMGVKLANIGAGGEGPSGASRSESYMRAKKQQLASLYQSQPWRRDESRAHAMRYLAAEALAKNPSDSSARLELSRCDAAIKAAAEKRREIEIAKHEAEKPARGDNIALGRGGRWFICHQNGKRYINQSAAARDLGLDPSQVSKVLRGRCAHTGGYTFEYSVL